MINNNQPYFGNYPYSNLISPYIDFSVLTSPANERHIHATDLAVLDGKYVLRINLAGYPKESIKVKTVGNKLTIHAIGEDVLGDEIKVMSREIPYGDFNRVYELTNVDINELTAKYDSGVLSVIIPRKSMSSEVSEREINI